jgi:hypothetical protein
MLLNSVVPANQSHSFTLRPLKMLVILVGFALLKMYLLVEKNNLVKSKVPTFLMFCH